MGALPNVFPGYQPVTDADAVAKLANAWACAKLDGGTDPSQQVAHTHKPGLTVTEMIEKAGSAEVRGLYIVGEDPVLTEPDSNHVRASLAASEFVVLQEIFPSETSHYADILLPGATFAEKSGTFTNTERRVQLVRPAIAPLSDARPDWAITADLARRMLALETREPNGPHAFWCYETAADVMNEIAAVTPSYAGVSHTRLERGHELQWPVLDAHHPGTPILHVDRFTRGKGKFHAIDHLPAKELPDEHYPLLLTTGRVLYHWHGGELTRRAQGLLKACPETLLEISPTDAARIGVRTDSQVRVISRRGEMIAQAMVTERISTGVVFGNFHFPGPQNVNNVTIAALDPVAKIPEYKVCAVRVELA
jgi:formate dehydrogenase major subunit/formate dehydrogenase alpha subunit